MRALTVEELGFVSGGFGEPNVDGGGGTTKPDWITPSGPQVPAQQPLIPYRPSGTSSCLPGYTPSSRTVKEIRSRTITTEAEAAAEGLIYELRFRLAGSFTIEKEVTVTNYYCIPTVGQPVGGSFGWL
jgi:hypothetical protein